MPATAEQRQEDYALMQRIATGDEAAVGALYDRFGPLIYRMAYQMLPSKSDAEDAVQDVFVRLWRTAERYDPERAGLPTWVVLIARRYLVDRLRRARARIKTTCSVEEDWSPDPDGVDPLEGLDGDERFAELMQRVERLPEMQRKVVTRAYLGGRTLRQIGAELDTPLGTIKSTLSRALVRLREQPADGSASK